MSRNKSKRKTDKKKKKLLHSTIEQHHRQGKRLVPPLASIPKLRPRSWSDNRLPDVLWASLLLSTLPRDQVLDVFREVAKYVHENKDNGIGYDVTHTGLSTDDPVQLRNILGIITQTEEQRHSLGGLLLLTDLPAIDIWKELLKPITPDIGWKSLMVAVAKTLDHQSQESTDCRWLLLLCMIASGKLSLQDEELAREILDYPNYGDMKQVRSFIRSAEIGLDSANKPEERDWPNKFWEQCYKDTKCFPLGSIQHLAAVVGTTPERVRQVYESVVEHCNHTNVTTAADPRHDIVFGFALYSLSILQELLRIGASQSITARISLRTLIESYITLVYLLRKNDPELWKTFRVFGAGQAKLQYLKLEDLAEIPSYVDVETLKILANEDLWEEFLPIELGHWNKADLRNLSIEAGSKDDYDKYYAWTSSFTHGHWGSMRESVYDTCGNPLHRLHRIPRRTTRALPDVIPDACEIIDKILRAVDECYPGFPHRVSI